MTAKSNIVTLPEAKAELVPVEAKSPPVPRREPPQLARAEAKVIPPRHKTKPWFSLIGISAAIMVLIPTILAAYYYFAIASDQFVTPIKFAVRGGVEPGGGNDVGALAGLPGPASAVADAFVVTEFIKSRQAIEAVSREVDLKRIFSRDSIDRIARLRRNVPVEELVDYWRSMVIAHFDILTGIVSVDVRAFTAAESLAVAQAIVKASDELLFQMSDKSRRDRLRFAEQDVARGEERLRKARVAIQEFRDQERVLDPTRNTQAQMEGLQRLREELSRMQAELAAINSLSPNAPNVQVMRSRIRATEDQVKTLEKQLGDKAFGSRNDGQVSAQVGRFAELELDQQFAEKAYNAARDQLDRARAAAERRTVYLTVFVEPYLAQGAEFPKPARSVLVVTLCALGAWMLLLLVIYGVRDHML